jgi:hypothetical protein
MPLHLFDASGKRLLSYGSDTGVFRADLGYAHQRVLTAAGPHEVWSANLTQYRIEKWSDTGQLTARIERNVGFFRPWVDSEPFTPNNPRKPFVGSLWQDRHDRLWVAIHVASPEWKKHVRRPPGAPPDVYYWDPEAINTVIDIIDLRRGELLVSQQVLPWIARQVSDDLLVSYEENKDVPQLRVWRVRLTSN